MRPAPTSSASRSGRPSTVGPLRRHRRGQRRLVGRTCIVEPLVIDDHVDALFEAYSTDDGRSFTYLPWAQPQSVEELTAVIGTLAAPDDQMPHVILVDDRPVGMACYLRIQPSSGSIEVGGICHSPALARTAASTEAMFLMADAVFDLGYRRYEWKCDSLNGPSNAAARRLGFTYEGRSGNARHQGRSRDTNWLSITDAEWPRIRAAIVSWLDPANFDETGDQRRPLDVRA